MKTVILVLFAAVCVCGQTSSSGGPSQIPFSSVDRVGEMNSRAFFVFQTSVRSYAIRHDGHAEASPLSVRRQDFALKTGGAGRIERLYFAEFENDLLLEYEVKDQRGHWGFITRMDQKKLVPRWSIAVSTEDLGPGLIDQQELYIAGANLLAKIDLHKGNYLWKQSGVESFYSFSVPSMKGETVVFRDDADSERTIEVDKLTGRVIKQ